ncbi:MAG: class I SAM-dependent methyltransferase, partial [Methanococcaceae archaeon]
GISLIANNSINCTISGIDYSELMYEKAKKRNKKFIDSGIVDLRYGNILTANMNGEKYDKIFCINVIYFWSDLLPVFQKIYSILNPGGIYCIYMLHEKEIKKLKFTKEFCKYPIEEVEAGLCEAGFKSVEYKLDTGYYIKATK